ncbi:hypothetical protein H6F32_11480 [Anabaena sp. FACHB-1237]|uniref:hypothetical protein n=1 Tax=Anabaena sp. FACHB-1237 TaxID=2692769 RepID=UPI00167FE4EB|nr:hypothetical protein [Anabaena sp. FACHB-1237]MBD2138196.1 hypothetical protein [Anabaena sp. FACHB-1237]
MKYFFLAEGWKIGRVWASDGLWQMTAWRRQPEIKQLNVCLMENEDLLWLYSVEADIVTIEVKPVTPELVPDAIGKVVLKRLMSAEQVIEKLATAQAKCHLHDIQLVIR